MKLRLYLDTSVFSAYVDERAPERRRETMEFWERLPEFEAATSEVTRREVGRVPDAAQRERLLRLVEEVAVHAVTDEMRALAKRYMEAGIFPTGNRNDALHVAAAALTRQDVVVSWNFRHLVNRRRRAAINHLNVSSGLPTIDIVAPPEV